MHRGDKLVMLVITMFQVFYAFGVMFIGCELCQQINLAFDGCNDVFAQFKWHLLPAEIQRMFPFIIHYTQQPVNINCFGSWACNRETFKCVSLFCVFTVDSSIHSSFCFCSVLFLQLIRTAFSYFMVLREFS